MADNISFMNTHSALGGTWDSSVGVVTGPRATGLRNKVLIRARNKRIRSALGPLKLLYNVHAVISPGFKAAQA